MNIRSNLPANKHLLRNIVIGITIGIISGFIFGYSIFSNKLEYRDGFIEISEHRYMFNSSYNNTKKPIFEALVFSLIAGSLGLATGVLVSKRTKWKRYKGGWGVKIDGGDKEHISATNEKADIGKGFHITIAGNRTYFDFYGNYLGDGKNTAKLLKRLNKMKNDGIISESQYEEAIKKIVEMKKT